MGFLKRLLDMKTMDGVWAKIELTFILSLIAVFLILLKAAL